MDISEEEYRYSLEQLFAQFFKDEGFMQRVVIQNEDGVYENYQEVNAEYEASKLVNKIYSKE